MEKRIWLIGGTQESGAIAEQLVRQQIPCVVTVTTESARSLYPIASHLTVQVGYLKADHLANFLQKYGIIAILDASHPFAVEISQLAIAAASTDSLPYLRFERINEQSASNPLEQSFSSFEDLLASDVLSNQRALLTIGYRSLPLFQPWQTRSVLFARILPSEIALKTALAAGFTSDRLIALRPPISPALEKALWQQWQVSCIVTKASGAPGGEGIKRQLAAMLGVQLITIDRPAIQYPHQTKNLDEAVEFCIAQQLHSRL
ncbi:MAG: cobalt-precorrin-6A reductase [Alkalinema sp. CACIAM 70d]|nr:MAG: cobalt-precorrin-6A reductase [Alkalinema sp. CACIAM 70d]